MTAFALIVTGFAPAATAFAVTIDPEIDVPTVKTFKASEPGAQVSWSAVDCDRYIIQVATDKEFTNNAQAWGVASDKTSYKIKGKKLINNKQYYVRMRVQDGSEYSQWSDVKGPIKLVTTTTGLKDSNVDKYRVGKKKIYYKNSIPYTGKVWADDDSYYFEKGKFVALNQLMWKGAKNAKSKTKYLVMTDCKHNWTYIYTGKKGKWKIYKRFRCTTGADATPTPKVNKYKPGGNKLVFGGFNDTRGRKPYRCWYASRFQGSCFYHSVLYWKDDRPRRIMSGALGVSRSHGCIRVSLKNAIWMYRHIGKGTRIITFSKKIPKAK